MRTMKVKEAIIIFLMIGIMAVVAGCARGPTGPGETNYQLKITVEVAGEINTDEGIYYVVLDADSESIDGPVADINFWYDEYYYIKLENDFFSFAQVKDEVESTFYGGSFSGNKLQATIALSDLGNPNSIDINVITTDLDNNNYDYLDEGYFTISTEIGSEVTQSDSPDDSGEGEINFNLLEVYADISIL